MAYDADALMADIVAKRLICYLERAGFVVMKTTARSTVTRRLPWVWREGLGGVAR